MNVLVVDDELIARRAAAHTLQQAGYDVTTAQDGREALDILARDTDIELVVTDVMMPEMTGTELAAEVKRRHPAMRILFVTGYVGEAGDAHDLAGRELLRKPFTVNALAGAVAAALGPLSGSPPAAADEAAE